MEKQRGKKSMTGNLGICRTEIGSHLKRLSKRKADFTADGSAVAGLQTPGAQLGLSSARCCCCRPVNTITFQRAARRPRKRRAIFSSPLSLLDHMQIKSWVVKEITDSDMRLNVQEAMK